MVNVHRICQKVGGIFVPSTTPIFMFDKTSLPDRICCGIFNLKVWQYVPNLLLEVSEVWTYS